MIRSRAFSWIRVLAAVVAALQVGCGSAAGAPTTAPVREAESTVSQPSDARTPPGVSEAADGQTALRDATSAPKPVAVAPEQPTDPPSPAGPTQVFPDLEIRLPDHVGAYIAGFRPRLPVAVSGFKWGISRQEFIEQCRDERGLVDGVADDRIKCTQWSPPAYARRVVPNHDVIGTFCTAGLCEMTLIFDTHPVESYYRVFFALEEAYGQSKAHLGLCDHPVGPEQWSWFDDLPEEAQGSAWLELTCDYPRRTVLTVWNADGERLRCGKGRCRSSGPIYERGNGPIPNRQ